MATLMDSGSLVLQDLEVSKLSPSRVSRASALVASFLVCARVSQGGPSPGSELTLI